MGVWAGHPMDATKPYEFISFGAMDVTKPYKFIGFGAMDITKPCKFIGFGRPPRWPGPGGLGRPPAWRPAVRRPACPAGAEAAEGYQTL